MAARLLRLIALGALPLVLAGCVSIGGGKKAPPELLTLTPAVSAPAGSTASGSPAAALLVLEPETDQHLAVLRVPVQVDAARIAYLKDAVWIERPARLFRALLAETLRARGGLLVLEDNQAIVPVAGTRLAGRLIAMGYDAPGQAVVVRYDAIRTTSGGAVQTRRFESVLPGIPAKAEAVGPALNRAANDVAAQVAAWIAG